MKKGILLLVGLLTLTTVNAVNETSTSKIGVNYNYSDAISFVERGIKFDVFLNGEFDFNSNYTSYYSNRGVRIERGYNGRVRRIGNVNVNYDYRGNVKRIGNVYMRYNRGLLTRVGNLKINYNRFGEPYYYGNVKYNDYYNDNFGVSFGLNFGTVCNYNDAYFYRNDFRNNYYKLREDNNFYYYRARPNAKIGKRSKILKRRKQNTSRDTKNTYKNNDSRRNHTTKRPYKNKERTASKRNYTTKRPSSTIKRSVVKRKEIIKPKRISKKRNVVSKKKRRG
ncbi:hypothetical protein OD91_0469 [Lutibacter sp. Hel_I_33_5]|uniref:hypothetical protein n=1 Tax=Lutibacter sp. Hel_I_33_5 TaxID=1566289 RepID=UPI0011A3040D|nr:hypothetical protein [Lutibacter sp. Hel_I_33_5]TVZ55224.1 hypothetical protein OD91_0469 [Lutibacter sp. Hel_I_33_5]